MNRNNFLPHVALALVLILIAAFAGQIRQWQKQWRAHHHGRPGTARPHIAPEPAPGAPGRHDSRAGEFLVRFKSGTSEASIQSIVSRLHDRVEDESESVSGLEVIEEEDGKDIDTVVAEYRALPEVEYAEPIFEIRLDAKPVVPNDPRFGEQWALANDGQRGGKNGADISAMRAWAVTKGSDKVVV